MGQRRAAAIAVLVVLAGSTGGCTLLVPEPAGGVTGWYQVGGVDPEDATAASWTTAPTDPDPAFRTAAVDQCLGHGPDPATASVLQDQRGTDGAAFLFLGQGEADCLVIRDGSAQFHAVVASWTSQPVGPVTSLDLRTFAEGRLSAAVGWVDPRTATVELMTATGRRFSTAARDGRFVTWWPGPDEVVGVRAIDADGALIEDRMTGPLTFVTAAPSRR